MIKAAESERLNVVTGCREPSKPGIHKSIYSSMQYSVHNGIHNSTHTSIHTCASMPNINERKATSRQVGSVNTRRDERHSSTYIHTHKQASEIVREGENKASGAQKIVECQAVQSDRAS